MKVVISQYYDANDRAPRWVEIPVKDAAEGERLVETLRKATTSEPLTRVELRQW